MAIVTSDPELERPRKECWTRHRTKQRTGMELVAYIVRSLVSMVIIYGAEGWTLTKSDEKRSKQQNCGSNVGWYESVGLSTEQTKVYSASRTSTDSYANSDLLCAASSPLATQSERWCELVKCVVVVE